MSSANLKKFLNEQVKEMEKAKWLEGIKLGRDPGQEFIHKWIKENARRFRKGFVEKDLQEALEQLEKAKRSKNGEVSCLIEKCKDKIKEALELFED